MTTRVRNQRGEGERLRTSLLDAAADLLAETQDVDQLSVRSVTARAGVSPTALYLHFEDKEQLTQAVKERCVTALADMLRAAEAEHEGDALAQVRAMGIAYLRFAREQPGQYAILFHTRGSRAAKDQPGEAHAGVGGECFELLINAVVRALRATGDSGDPFEISTMLWMTLHGRATIRTSMPDFPLPEDERFVELLGERTFRGPLSA